MVDLKALAEKIGPEEWTLNTGIGFGDAARKDVDRLGWFVFKPYWGAVATTPKDSPQFSRHSSLMSYIAAADPKAVLDLFEEIERLRAKIEHLDSQLTASLHREQRIARAGEELALSIINKDKDNA